MYEKNSKYLADWRDKKGVRHRKAFTPPKQPTSTRKRNAHNAWEKRWSLKHLQMA